MTDEEIDALIELPAPDNLSFGAVMPRLSPEARGQMLARPEEISWRRKARALKDGDKRAWIELWAHSRV